MKKSKQSKKWKSKKNQGSIGARENWMSLFVYFFTRIYCIFLLPKMSDVKKAISLILDIDSEDCQ